MPIYLFACSRGHVTERRAGYDCAEIPCPFCNSPAERKPVYENQYIIGETVARSVPQRSNK